jgi:predicted secreted protein
VKTGYLIQSSIVIVVLCAALIIASAQSSPFGMGIPSFEGLSSYMESFLGGSEGRLNQMSAQNYVHPAMSMGTGMFNFSIPSMTMPGGGSISGVSQQVDTSAMGAPGFDFSAFNSTTLMPTLLSNAVTQTNFGAKPSAVNNYTIADNGSTINMNVNDTIYVQLPFQIQNGSVWNLTTTGGLNVTNQKTTTPTINPLATSGAIDLTAIQEFAIKAVKPGTQYVNAICSGTNQTYSLTVIVS